MCFGVWFGGFSVVWWCFGGGGRGLMDPERINHMPICRTEWEIR